MLRTASLVVDLTLVPSLTANDANLILLLGKHVLVLAHNETKRPTSPILGDGILRGVCLTFIFSVCIKMTKNDCQPSGLIGTYL